MYYLAESNVSISFLASVCGYLNPSAWSVTFAIKFWSGLLITTGLKSCLRLSGNLFLPP